MLVKVGEKYNISLKVIDANEYPVFDDIVVATIEDKSNKKFFNGLFWVDGECGLMIPHVGDGVYSIYFIPEQVSVYEIKIQSRTYSISKHETIQSVTDLEGDDVDNDMSYSPITKITSRNFKNQDGTDTTIVDINNKPVAGVKITCYDAKTKEVVAVSQSDTKGDWEMIIKHGVYFFTFEKDGYITVSFERTVSTCL